MQNETRHKRYAHELNLFRDRLRGLFQKSGLLYGFAGLVVFGLTCGAGCGGEEAEETDTDTGESPDTDDDAGSGSDTGDLTCGPLDTELADGDADELFNRSTVPTFDLYLPPDAWEQLQVDARDEEYVEAEACFEGRGLGKVGLRFKGNVGSLYSCFDDKGENLCAKLGIKLKFTEYDEEGRFFGMKRLNFQSNRADDTYMRENLAYAIFRSAGIVAPRSSWAQIRVNDELLGLYGMVEQIDGRFTADRWPDDGDGNLYKEVWPIDTDESSIIARLKTNEEDPDVSAFVAFSEAMNAAKTEDLRETLGKYTDLDYLARYMVVDDAVINSDGVTAYYISEDATWSGNHNYYFYEEGPKAYTIIPWDLGATFMPTAFGYLPHWTEIPEDCDQQTYSAWGNPDLHVKAPGCDRIFQAMAQDLTAYRTYGQTFLDEIFTEKKLISLVDDYAAFLEEAVDADPTGPGLKAFNTGIKSFKNLIPTLRTRLQALIDGEAIVPLEIHVDAINDFETQTDFGVKLGSAMYVGPGSSAEVGIDGETPLRGERSLGYTFEHGNGGEAYDQWSTFAIPISGGAADLNEVTGIRMAVRGDNARTFGVYLDNSFATEADDYLKPGWDFEITEESATYELLVEDIDWPWWVGSSVEPATAIEDVRGAVRGLQFQAYPVGVGGDGFFPDGTTDKGTVDIDDIEFF